MAIAQVIECYVTQNILILLTAVWNRRTDNLCQGVKRQKEAFFAIGRGICEIAAELIHRTHAVHSILASFRIEVLQANIR